jgi:hypothetical protein
MVAARARYLGNSGLRFDSYLAQLWRLKFPLIIEYFSSPPIGLLQQKVDDTFLCFWICTSKIKTLITKRPLLDESCHRMKPLVYISLCPDLPILYISGICEIE